MAAIHKSVDVAGLPGRLGTIRARYGPGSTARSFGRVVGDERWRKWEGGDVPGGQARRRGQRQPEAAHLSGAQGLAGI